MSDIAHLVGRTLDRKYRLEEQLGEGGMGAVFRATHTGTDRVVALKLIAPGLLEQEEFVSRFQREARAAGRLRHPNIVDLTDFGFAEVDGRPLAYLVMEYLEGETLASLLRRNPTPPLPFVVEVVGQVCSALQEAHDHGIVHRDLKPENLWLEPDRRGGQIVKILDFGLAKIYDPKARAAGKPGLPVADEATLAIGSRPKPVPGDAEGDGAETRLGTVLGTPAYMSPEQCRGVAVDPRSDLYSLGVVAYRMLSGRTPFEGPSLDLINKHIQSEPPSLAGLRKDLPPGLADLVMETLSKDPEKRPRSAEIFGNAFEAYAQDEVRTYQEAIRILLGRWREIVPLVVPAFLGPLVLTTALFLLSRFAEPALVERFGGGSSFLVFGAGIGFVLTWLFHAFRALAGRLIPLVLHDSLFPLSAFDAKAPLLTPGQERAVRRQNSYFSLGVGIFLVGFVVYLYGALKIAESAANPRDLRSFLVLLAWPALAGLWFLGARRWYGRRFELMSGVMFAEGLDVRASVTRIQALREALGLHPESWKLFNDVFAARFFVGGACFVGAFAAGGAWTLVGGTPAEGERLLAYSLWFTALIVLLSALTAALDGVQAALSYLRLRKIARESLREAFRDLEARLAGSA